MKKLTFPKNFMLGAAAAAHQYEGAYDSDNKGLSTADYKFYDPNLDRKKISLDAIEFYTDSYAEIKTNPNKIYPYRFGIDFYNRYKSDLKLFKETGVNCFRTSITWSRIFPDDGVLNKKGIDYYRDVFLEMKNNGIELIVTVSHFDFPIWFLEKYNGFLGGDKAIDKFLEFAKIVLTEFNQYVKYWLVFNEMNIGTYSSYTGGGFILDRDDPKRKEKLWQAVHNQFVAQAKFIKLAKSIDRNIKVGFMSASRLSYPNTCKPEDVLLNHQQLQKNLFFYFDLSVKGYYPKYMLNFFLKENLKIEMKPDDLKLLKEYTVDFLSFSYYSSFVISVEILEQTGGNLRSGAKNQYLESNEWGWQIDPIGLRVIMNEVYYRYNKPLLISENGIGWNEKWDNEKNQLNDTYRISYLKEHLKNVLLAIDDGVECLGYTTWTPFDLISASTKEISKRYGLIYVDQDDYGKGTKARKIKESGKWFKTIADSNGEKLWE